MNTISAYIKHGVVVFVVLAAGVAAQEPAAAKPVKTICELARQARARNSPAAPGLEAKCAAELKSAATAAAVLKADQLHKGVKSQNQRIKELEAEAASKNDKSWSSDLGRWLTGADPGAASRSVNPLAEKDRIGDSEIQNLMSAYNQSEALKRQLEKQRIDLDGKRGAANNGATTDLTLEPVQRAQTTNAIIVRVQYRTTLGYKGISSSLGSIGRTSCAAFSVVAAVNGETAPPRDPILITRDLSMYEAGDYYACNYLVSGIPTDKMMRVSVYMFAADDLFAPWQGGVNARPPTGQQRTILEATKTATLTTARPRAFLGYEMIYTPITMR